MIHRKTLFKKVKQVVHSFDPQARIILFGSRARGDYRKDSDWDFMVLTEKQFDWKWSDSIITKLYDVELETNQAIFATIENIENWHKNKVIEPLFRNIVKEGVEV
jgi:uncharacterized protein